MSKFVVSRAFGGSAIAFGPSYRGVEIGLSAAGLRQFDGHITLTAALATETEIDFAIDDLIRDLEGQRAIAKRKLAEYAASSKTG